MRTALFGGSKMFHCSGYSVSWSYPWTDISHWGRLVNTFKLLVGAPSHLPISSLQNFTHTWTAATPSLHCCCAPCQEHGFPQTVEWREGFKTKWLVSDICSEDWSHDWPVLLSKESREVQGSTTQLAKRKWHSEVCVCSSIHWIKYTRVKMDWSVCLKESDLVTCSQTSRR